MPTSTLENTIAIAAPIEQVCHLACAIEHIPEWFLGAKVANVNPTDIMVDTTWDWSYRIWGWRFRGQARLVEYEEPHRSATETSGGVVARFLWTYAPRDGETLVKSTVDYSVPMGLFGQIADRLLVRRAFASNVQRSLENLKRACES